MNKIKILSVCLAAGLTLSAFGCARNNVASDNVINWYMLKAGDNMSDQELVEKEANKIFESKLGTKLKLHLLDSGSYDKKMNTMIAAGEEFDICMTTSWTNNFVSNVQRGAFIDLTELLKEYGKDILAKSDPVALEALNMNGKMYAIKSQTPYSGKTGRAYNKDLVEKYNFDYKNAQSLDALEPFLKQIKENEPGIVPVLVTAKSGLPTEVDTNLTDNSIAGLNFNEEKQQYVIKYEDPKWQETARKINDFYRKGYISSNAITLTETVVEAKTGKYAVLPVSGNYTEDGSKSSDTYGFECVETYLGDKVINTGAMFDALNAISVTSKKPEKAVQLLNLIWADPDLSNMLAYGIEGVNYTIDNERSAQIGEKSVIPKSGNQKTWGIPHNWIGPLWDQWDSSWNRREALEEMQENNRRATKSSTLGFLFDSSKYKTELAKVSAIVEECSPVFATGSMPDFDVYVTKTVEKLKQAGIETILNAANEQLEEWRKTK